MGPWHRVLEILVFRSSFPDGFLDLDTNLSAERKSIFMRVTTVQYLIDVPLLVN